jgi:hypothetical protein
MEAPAMTHRRRLGKLVAHTVASAGDDGGDDDVAAATGSSFVGVAPGQPKPALNPPIGQVHTKTADGSWEINGTGSAWEPRPGPSFAEMQASLTPHPSGAAWPAVEVDAADIESLFSTQGVSSPLEAVANGTVPAVIIRGALRPEHCARVVEMFIARGLMRDPKVPADEADEDHTVTEGKVAGYGNGTDTRIDIGSSLVNQTRGALALRTPSTRGGTADDDTLNKEAFLAHSKVTLDLFDEIFEAEEEEDEEGGGDPNPVTAFMGCMNALSEPAGQTVKVAYEPDGRQYGPCIFRVHYESWAYSPHINHVRLGDSLFNFEAGRFEHQFAGLICFANAKRAAEYGGAAPGATIYRTFPTAEVEMAQQHGSLEEYCEAAGIPATTLDIHEGDFCAPAPSIDSDLTPIGRLC